MKNEEKNNIDERRIKAVIHDNVPNLNDEELTNFLVSEIYENKETALKSAQHLNDIIGEHLINFGYCKTEDDCVLICESIIEDLEKPEPKEEDDEVDNSENDYPDGICVLCEREMPLTFHHLIPRTTHKKLLKRGANKKDLNKGIMLCRPCHSAIHRLIDAETMAAKYNTLEKLLEHEGVQKWIPYAMKQKEVSKDHALNFLKYKK